MTLDTALTFDDILILPAFSNVKFEETDASSFVTKRTKIKVPILSAAMDMVTEDKMAIALAQLGGIGVLHRNCSPEYQADMVKKVKKHDGGIVKDPFTVGEKWTLKMVKDFVQETGVSSFPVVREGKILVGLITSRDIRFEKNELTLVKDIMTGLDELSLAFKDMKRQDMVDMMRNRKVERLPIVIWDNSISQFILEGLITLKDHLLQEDHPLESRNEDGKLLVAAAIGPSNSHERATMLIDAGADILVIDAASGYTEDCMHTIKTIKSSFPYSQIIAGNVVTSEAASALCSLNIDGIKVGLGSGSICTTRIVTGIGMPQFSAIKAVVEEAQIYSVPVICDGGIRTSGDMVKAIVAGADSVMLGSLLAGTTEAPGDVEFYQGKAYKPYRGMGSLSVMKDEFGRDRYGTKKTIPQGIEGRIPFRGPLADVIEQLVGGLKLGMMYTGSRTLTEMCSIADYVKITNQGLIESHPHSVEITKFSPNYPQSEHLR